MLDRLLCGNLLYNLIIHESVSFLYFKGTVLFRKLKECGVSQVEGRLNVKRASLVHSRLLSAHCGDQARE